MDEVDARDIAAQQAALERAARRAFPYDPDACTLYMDIAPRQLLYACATCAPANALCYACAVRCHGAHRLVALDSKRGFRCDCGTDRLRNACQLRCTTGDSWANEGLRYCDNFLGKFCTCKEKTTDASYGHGAMVQCLMGTQCGEDWFHARCIAGLSWAEERARGGSIDENLDEGYAGSDGENSDEGTTVVGTDTEDMAADETSDFAVDADTFALFPELPSAFGAVICPRCIADAPSVVESSAVLSIVNGYTFLRRDYGNIFRSDPGLRSLTLRFPFLNGDEQTYTPDVDTAPSSLLEAGEEALQNLPRDSVLTGLRKFRKMEKELIGFLTNIANEGRAVSTDDIHHFFGCVKAETNHD